MAMNKKQWRPDVATVGGLLLAFGGILGGLVLEGGNINDVRQFTAAMIVLGGTFGAVMVTTPSRTLWQALRSIPNIFSERIESREQILARLIAFATKARKSGIVSLDDDLESIEDPFLKKTLMLAIDGMDIKELRYMMELEIDMEEHNREAVARVFESAGGYSPTIGIIGAVLGLIQVMKHIENIDEVGRGIAVAFVATVYGVGLANVILLPAATKLRAKLANDLKTREMIVEGSVSIVEGLNPKLIESKLEAYLNGRAAAKRNAPKTAAQGARPLAETAGS
jgi:chemotaxis protein MotA